MTSSRGRETDVEAQVTSLEKLSSIRKQPTRSPTEGQEIVQGEIEPWVTLAGWVGGDNGLIYPIQTSRANSQEPKDEDRKSVV